MAEETKSIRDQLFDELLKDCKSPEDITGEDGLLKQLGARAKRHITCAIDRGTDCPRIPGEQVGDCQYIGAYLRED